MPSSQVYAIVGDSNVRRNMTAMNIASRESMTDAKVIDCKDSESLVQALRDVPSDVTVCLIQTITSFLVTVAFAGTVFGTVDPVLAEFTKIVRSFCTNRPSVQVFLAPPMYQFVPFWYRRHLPEISHQFSTILSSTKLKNLFLLSSPINQELCSDGVHLTPVAGLHYLINLFDEVQRVLLNLGSKGISRVCFLLVCCWQSLV